MQKNSIVFNNFRNGKKNLKFGKKIQNGKNIINSGDFTKI